MQKPQELWHRLPDKIRPAKTVTDLYLNEQVAQKIPSKNSIHSFLMVQRLTRPASVNVALGVTILVVIVVVVVASCSSSAGRRSDRSSSNNNSLRVKGMYIKLYNQ